MGYSHEDLKLSDFLIPAMTEVDQSTITLCDFGKCERVSSEKGNARSQIYTDLEMLFFLFCYMVKGFLPWKHKYYTNIFNNNRRHLVKDSQIQQYLFSSFSSSVVSLYSKLKQSPDSPSHRNIYQTMKEAFQ